MAAAAAAAAELVRWWRYSIGLAVKTHWSVLLTSCQDELDDDDDGVCKRGRAGRGRGRAGRSRERIFRLKVILKFTSFPLPPLIRLLLSRRSLTIVSFLLLTRIRYRIRVGIGISHSLVLCRVVLSHAEPASSFPCWV